VLTIIIANCYPEPLSPSKPLILKIAMFALRRLSHAPARRLAATTAAFHSSAPAFVKLGDRIPNVDLMEGSPGNKVKIADELAKGRSLIIGKHPRPIPS
jgi:hypothetical protein